MSVEAEHLVGEDDDDLVLVKPVPIRHEVDQGPGSVLMLPVHYDKVGGGQPIVLQPKNGPCALIALANALSLSGRLSLSGLAQISLDGLCQLLSNAIIERQLQKQSMVDVERLLGQLMSLREGACLDPRFCAIDAFSEPNTCCEVYGLAGVPLYHGMLL